MKIITKDYIEENKYFILSEMKLGKIFVHPTDTLYGIGCNAQNSNSIKKIFEIKKRPNKPFLVISPSIKWIQDNCEFNKDNFNKFKLPGPYSFIVELKNKELVCSEVLSDNNKLGVRFPNCYFKSLVGDAGIPFVSTSLNISGEPPILDLENIPKEIIDKVDYLIKTDETLLGRASELYDLTSDELKRLR